MSVASLIQRIEQREQSHWDREARRLGFKNFADLEIAESEAFDAAWSELEKNCNHPNKHPDLNVCECCAESFRA
jgi:hypothetical protein